MGEDRKNSRSLVVPRRPRTNVRAFYLLIFAAWLLLAELLLITIIRGRFPKPLGTVGGWTSFIVAVCLLVASGSRELAIRHTESRRLYRQQETLEALRLLTEPLLRSAGVVELLHEMATRCQTVLQARCAAIYLIDQDSTDARLAVVAGIDKELWPGSLIEEHLVATVGASPDPVTWSSPAGTVATPSCAQSAACRLLVGERVTGVCVVADGADRTFDDLDLRLLRMVANHIAVRVERARLDELERNSRHSAEHARKQLSLIAQAGGLLAPAIDDYRASLEVFADLMVPEFADWCLIDLAERGAELQRLVFRHGEQRWGPGSGTPPPEDVRGAAGLRDWERLCEQALQSGRPQRSATAADPSDGTDDDATSCLVAPIRAGGLVLGTLTFATDPGRPPLEASDLAVAKDIAGRVSAAVERVLLYREVSEAGQVAAQTATQLRQLVESSLALQQARSGAEILSIAAGAARGVLGVDLAVVWGRVSDGETFEAVAATGAPVTCHAVDAAVDIFEDPGEGWLSVPLRTWTDNERGAVAVRLRDTTGPDDQTVAMLLGQLTSAALDAMDHYRTAQRREDRWRALIEATPAAIVEMTLDGRVQLWNRSAAAMFGWPDHVEAQESGVAPRFRRDTRVELSKLWARTMEGEETVDSEVIERLDDGAVRDLRVSVAPLSSEGAVYGTLTLATDVTDQNRLRERMSRAQQMEALGQVAGGVAHDFNNLLTVISGSADLLNRGVSLSDTDRELLEGIRAASDRASVLTHQLLAISSHQAVNRIPVAPHATLNALRAVIDRILGVDIRLSWRVDPDAGPILIDPGRFEQVILNLAINARDAMPTGGRLEIATSATTIEDRFARKLNIPAGDYVRITVADTGEGMDDITKRRCFEPFFTTKDRAKGTGLGLAAVHSIVTESDGALTVTSTIGDGTTFDLYFPIVADQVVVEPPPSAVPRSRGWEVVLVVEDQPDVRKLVRRVLERDGYLVLEASSGKEAIHIAENWEGPIELLISDVVMPGMRGPEVAAAVKALRPGIKVLFTSAYTQGTVLADESAVEEVPNLLPKPFRPTELVARVREILDVRRSRLAQTDSRHHAPS
jgi:PAS domain S-box-containing protein